MSSILSLVRSVPIQDSAVNCCEWSPSGRLIAVGLKSGILRITDLHGRTVNPISTGDAVLAVSWSPDEKQIATAGSRVLIADVSTGEVTRQETLHSGPVWALAFSPDGKSLASGGEDGRVSIWRLHDDTVSRRPLYSDAVHAVCWTRLSELASCANDGLFKVLDQQLQVIQEVKFVDPLLRLTVSNNCSKFALGGKNGRIFIFDMESGGTQILEGHTSWVWTVRFASQDALLISECEDKTIKLWNSRDGFALASITFKRSVFGSIAVNDAQGFIAIPNEVRKTLEIWKFISAEILKRASKRGPGSSFQR
jgi:WD40 repeat protein